MPVREVDESEEPESPSSLTVEHKVSEGAGQGINGTRCQLQASLRVVVGGSAKYHQITKALPPGPSTLEEIAGHTKEALKSITKDAKSINMRSNARASVSFACE